MMARDASGARAAGHGFEVLPGLASPATLQAFGEAVAALMRADGAGAAEWVRRNPHDIDPVFAAGAHLDPILQRVEAALGTRAQLIETYVIYKPAKIGAETPWHQDLIYGELPVGLRRATLWLPLHAVDADESCLYYIPGSHLWSLLPHRETDLSFQGGPTQQIAELDYGLGDAVPCPLKAGDGCLHLDTTLHKSGPNTSGRSRVAVIFDWAVARPFWA